MTASVLTPPSRRTPAQPPHPPHAGSEAAVAVLSGTATALVGIAGVVFGSVGLFGEPSAVHVGWLLPLVGATFALDPLGGFFMAVIGAVAVAGGIYSVGYFRREPMPRFGHLALPLFAAAMLLVPAAGSVTTFLFAWELMAAAALVLVLCEHHQASVRHAALVYATLAQLGFVAILMGLVVLAAAGDADGFTALGERAAALPPVTRNAVFVLTVIGFGSKAGLLPLHAWLPRAHPEVPSAFSALVGGGMVNLGIYGIVRFDLQLLGVGPNWWGVTLLAIGAASAVFGALQASVATDLKRLLAYSTTENMGLITVALGAAALLAASHAPAVAAVAVTAALVQLSAHAGFKALGFMSAGAVVAGTGLRDLDRLGGLARRMPATTVLFGIAALGASGLPLGAGFVGEWLLLQSLIHAPHQSQTLLALTMPLAVGAVALTTGLGIAAMVKAFGVGFLARPRSDEAAQAREASPTMLGGMTLAALACCALAVAPVLLSDAIWNVLDSMSSFVDVHSVDLGWRLHLPGLAGSISPGLIAVVLAVGVLVALLIARWGARKRPAPALAAPLWACGAGHLSPRMQYTATSFAEPLQRVFDDVLRPDTDLEVTHVAESQYLVQKVAYRARLTDAVETRLYDPVVRAVQLWAGWLRRAHSGSVHLYLTFGFVGLLVVLVVAR